MYNTWYCIRFHSAINVTRRYLCLPMPFYKHYNLSWLPFHAVSSTSSAQPIVYLHQIYVMLLPTYPLLACHAFSLIPVCWTYIPGIQGYSDKGVDGGGHPGLVRDGLDIPDIHRYSDTEVGSGGDPRIVWDGLGIPGVRGYSDTGVVGNGHPGIVQDSLGTLLPCHRG